MDSAPCRCSSKTEARYRGRRDHGGGPLAVTPDALLPELSQPERWRADAAGAIVAGDEAPPATPSRRCRWRPATPCWMPRWTTTSSSPIRNERARGVVDPRYARAWPRATPRLQVAGPALLDVPEPPHEGRAPSQVQVGAMTGATQRWLGLLRLRPAWPRPTRFGRQPHPQRESGGWETFQAAVPVAGGRLRRLDLLSIESAAPRGETAYRGIAVLPGS